MGICGIGLQQRPRCWSGTVGESTEVLPSGWPRRRRGIHTIVRSLRIAASASLDLSAIRLDLAALPQLRPRPADLGIRPLTRPPFGLFKHVATRRLRLTASRRADMVTIGSVVRHDNRGWGKLGIVLGGKKGCRGQFISGAARAHSS